MIFLKEFFEMSFEIILALFSGVVFATGGVGYKVGANGNVRPIQCATFLSVVGVIGFTIMGWNEWKSLSMFALVNGVIVGFMQYVVISLLRTALKLGPLSPAWCAVSLGFIPVIIYSALSCGETLTVYKYLSIAATIGAIVSASFSSPEGEVVKHSVRDKIFYGIILVLLLVTNCSLPLSLKICSRVMIPGSDIPTSEACGNPMLAIVYFMILLCGVIDLTVGKKWVFNRYAFLGGGLLAFGASFGYWLQLFLVGRAPAVIVFAMSNTVSILATALISVFVLREKITKSWYFTIGFSILAILLNTDSLISFLLRFFC